MEISFLSVLRNVEELQRKGDSAVSAALGNAGIPPNASLVHAFMGQNRVVSRLRAFITDREHEFLRLLERQD